MTSEASLLVVDDDTELTQMLNEYLAGEGFRIVIVGDGAEAVERLGAEVFDLVILDVMLPSLNGFEILRRLRQTLTLTLPVIMLTARGADVDRIVGLELGADDYISKPFNPRELVARIRAVLRRLGIKEPEEARHPLSLGPLRLETETLAAYVDGHIVRLTGTELRVLETLMRAAGEVQSRESMTERVLGRRLTLHDRSIDTHVSNLRRKLGLGGEGMPEIRSVRGAGYVLTGYNEEFL